MKANRSDAPDYLKSLPSKKGAIRWVIPGLIGTAITLGALQTMSSAFLAGTVQGMAAKPTQPAPSPVAKITWREPAEPKDHWDRVVEEVAQRSEIAHAQQPGQRRNGMAGTVPKQTVFTDANYVPRGADNVLTFNVPPAPEEAPRRPEAMEITVVGQEPSMKDRACWPWKEGSLERRNCRTSIGLSHRD